jgi:hypothetical protein
MNCAGITELLTKYRKYGKIGKRLIPYRICTYETTLYRA